MSADTLTGLAGRESLLQSIAELKQPGNAGLMCMDIDHLASLNETMGLSAGDLLLVEASRRIAACKLETEFLFRTGGDEFALLLQGVNSIQVLEERAAELIESLNRPYLIAGRKVYFGASIGMAVGSDQLLPQAQAALARAKVHARGGWLMYTPGMKRIASDHLYLETSLRQALELNQFLVYYQPQVSCMTGRVTGFEALVRWNHPQQEIISPSDFIPALEKSGLIVPVGAWVLREACRQLSIWGASGYDRLQMSVNVSLRQLADPLFPELVGNTLNEFGLTSECLELELTESMLMHDTVDAEALLFRLKSMGIRLAIDDFGTGYSSLSYLKRLPIDTVKIDRAFVQDITVDPNDASITRAIIAMAHSLKMRVIAEGAETQAQLTTLINERCEVAQGFFIAKPLSSELATEFLASGRGISADLLGREARERTLLIVDDEEGILLALKRLLRREDYRVLTASSGSQALQILAETEVDVVVSDQRMPNMTGEEFLRRVKELYPGTIRIVLSGYADMQSISNAINQGAVYKFLSKPWIDAEIREAIQEAFNRKKKIDENLRKVQEFEQANTDLLKDKDSLSLMLNQQAHRAKIGHAALALAQDNLHYLPVPVMALDPEGMVVLRNDAFIKIAFPLQDCPMIKGKFPDSSQSAPFELHFKSFDQRKWQVLGRHLNNAGQHRGTVLVFLLDGGANV